MKQTTGERIRKAKQRLFIAINELSQGGSALNIVEAIDEYTLATITEAFHTHPTTANFEPVADQVTQALIKHRVIIDRSDDI
jgi:hypothetical protein